MNKLLLTVAILMLSATASMAQLRTVTDYFLAMPNAAYSRDASGAVIKGKAKVDAYRRSLIKTEDIKNGYLRLEGPWEGWAEIALFKRTGGGYIVAHAESGCGPACSGFVKFWTVSGGKWTNVTAGVFKELSDVDAAKLFNRKKAAEDETASAEGFSFYYLLPREGKTVRAACNECSNSGGDDFILAEWEFDGAKFVRK